MTTESNSIAESTAWSITVLLPHPRVPPIIAILSVDLHQIRASFDILSSILFDSEDSVDALTSRLAMVTEDSRTTVVGVSRANYGKSGNVSVNELSASLSRMCTYLFCDV